MQDVALVFVPGIIAEMISGYSGVVGTMAVARVAVLLVVEVNRGFLSW